MKKILLLATTFFCFSNFTHAQAGQLDPSFGNNGIVKADLGKNYIYNGPPAYQILLQANGNMYVIEGSTLIKRHSDGSVDSSFRVDLNFNGTNLVIKKAAIQSDGKIVVISSMDDSTKYDPDTDSYRSYFALARYKPDGSIDSSFAEDGLQTTSFGFYNDGYSVVIQKDGKIMAAGSSDSKLALARYNTDGSLDKTFDGDGKLTTTSAGAFASLAVQADGKIVVAGTLYSTYDPNSGQYLSDFAVVRYNTDGSLDNTFSNDGMQTTDFGSEFNVAEAAVIQSDGKIVVGGYFVKNYMGIFALARYNSDGSLDKSFSGDGKQATGFGLSSAAGIYAIAIQSDGKIVVAGDCLNSNNSQVNYLSVARYKNDGSLDKSFSDDGKILDFGSENTSNKAFTVAIQNNGKIVAGGSFNSRTALARYNTDGSPDKTFDKDGKLIDGFHSGNTIFSSTAVQKDGKAVAVGRTWNGSNFDFAIARYNTDGSLDKTFSSDGKQTTDFAGKDDYANSVAIQNDGKTVVAGYSNSFGSNNIPIFSVARYNVDGSLDNTFDGDGKLQTNFEQASQKANSVAIQSDGKIVVAGSAEIKDSYGYYTNSFALARYNADGSLDNTFDKDGKQTVVFFDSDSAELPGRATSVAIQNDGKVAIGGIVGEYDNESTLVARFNTNGSLDNTFGFEGKAYTGGSDAKSFSIALQQDGKIVAGGFYDYRGYNGNFVRRLTTNGKPDSSFSSDGREDTEFEFNYDAIQFDFSSWEKKAVAIQSDGKIIVTGGAFTRYKSDGTLDSTFGKDGKQQSSFYINAIAISNNKLYAAGSSPDRRMGMVARYLLNNSNTPPTVSLMAPKSNATYLAPAAHIKLSAAAADKDGIITKVEFYNGNKLLHTETVFPYGYLWRNVSLGNYTLTAKAYDNNGNITTSAPVHIFVVPNKPPVVSITKPVNNRSFAAPGYIHLEAAASDTDGRVTNVKFYNGTTLLRTEYEFPYTYHWENVPAGTYTITAVATDNWGAHTTSAPVTIRVTSANAMIVSNKPINNKTGISNEISLKLSPNPATNIVSLYTSGLQQNKPATISITSVSGIVLKTIQTNNSTIQLDVSSLVSGVYTIKIVSGDRITYKQFVKL